MPNLSRRKLIGSLISLVAAPPIVRVSSIMSVKAMEPLRYMGIDLAFDEDRSAIQVVWNGYEFWCNGKDHIVHWRDGEKHGVWR